MLASPCHSLPALHAGVVVVAPAAAAAYLFCREKCGWGGGNAAARPVRAVAARAGLSSFFSSTFGLDSQTFQTSDGSDMLWIGPVPGDIAEVEAYCRIFRAAEKLQGALMDTLCNPETGECAVSYDVPSEDLPMLEEKVVAILGCMLALLSRERENVLSGRSSFMNTFQIADVNILDGKLPPLAIFRREMKRCCESLQVALANYLPPLDERNREIWRRLQGLQNVCYDAGFSRGDQFPCPTLFANWSPVYFSSRKEGQMLEDSEVAFWRGGQVTEEGLAWLLEREFKTIVDLREENAKDEYCQSLINEAVLCGKIEVVNLPVEIGTAPSMDQVEQFASLVMDPTKKPIYLHSKEGVGRASAMVSRWRQFITRPSLHSTLSHLLGQNGKPAQNIMYDEYKSLNTSVSSETKFGKLSEDGVSSLSKTVDAKNRGEAHSAQEIIDACVENENKSVAYELASLHNNEATDKVDDLDMENPKLYIESDPLKAQFPTGNIFSRKAMQAFYKSKKVYPQTHLSNYRSQIELAPTSNGLAKVPIQSSGTLANSQLSNEKSQGYLERKTVGDSVSVDLVNSSNGTSKHDSSDPSILNGNGSANAKQTLTGKLYASDNSDNKLQKQTLVIGTETKRNKVGGYVSNNGNLAVVEDNMCASATGVVRVQSRKKAEMFLVRTDGFSCTREKVTEASLAFTHPSTQQQMLMWKSPPRTVLLLKKLGDALMEEAKEVASFLYYQEKMNVLVEPDVHDIFARIPGFGFVQTFYNQDTSDLHERVDFITCLGGDGVILHASNLFRGPVPPVVSFNLGSLGFLTSHAFEDYKNDLRAVIHGNNTLGVYITLRMRLRCEIFRNGKAVPGKVFDVLNEVVVDRGSNPYLSKIECYEHNRLITKVQGDGVIVATPTGSTAYSTAAGGSMVHPNVPCMLFTPICPHSLSFRPVILPDSSRLELRIPGDTRNNAWVSFDGKRRQQLSRGDSVHISMSQHPLPTVNKSDQTGDWFRSLIRCLNWNERMDQKAL